MTWTKYEYADNVIQHGSTTVRAVIGDPTETRYNAEPRVELCYGDYATGHEWVSPDEAREIGQALIEAALIAEIGHAVIQ